MELIETLTILIGQGEILAPKGGDQKRGYTSALQADYVSWRLQAISAIEQLGGTASGPLLRELEGDKLRGYFYKKSASRVLGALQGALAIAERQAPARSLQRRRAGGKTYEVFVAHGHDEAMQHKVARFLDLLQLKPIILVEIPGEGKTIIEKLEQHASVVYAVVLLTPDDVGRSVKDTELKPRARQNVVLEFGYFLAKLGRGRVAVLYDESVEPPSDYHGVEYIKIDAGGAWKLSLGKQMKKAGLPVDMNDV